VDYSHVVFWPGLPYRYSGKKFEIPWGDGLKLFQIYSKEYHHNKKKMRIREKIQVGPAKQLKDAFMDKISAEQDDDRESLISLFFMSDGNDY
jgi:hypothetical protein